MSLRHLDRPLLSHPCGGGGFVVPRSPRTTARLQKGSAARSGSVESGVSDSRSGTVASGVGKLDPIAQSSRKSTISEGAKFFPMQWVLKSQSPEKGNTTNIKEKIKEIETFMSVSCARHVAEPQRGTNVGKALDSLSRLYPSLSGVLLTLRRYVKELSTSNESLQESSQLEIKKLEETIYKKYESFFEEKTLQLLREKRKSEAVTRQLREEILMLRRERDTELMGVKEAVMIRLNECERKEDEFSSFRKLIASVFQTNERLVNRIDDLEAVLRKHRIGIPPVDDELYMYSKPKNNNMTNLTDGWNVKRIQDQVSPEFIEASRQEMNLARLSLQRELLTSAFDERTTYRLQVNGLRNENSSLQLQIESLQEQVIVLERYIHEKRYLLSEGVDGNVPLTPRPRNVPFSVQTDLGIDLKNSTSRVVAELSAVGTNLKHQLNSAVMTLRRLASAVEWMEDETMLIVAKEADIPGVLPVFQTAEWPNIPHFLRTHVEPDVPNLNWTDVEVSAFLMEFFANYSSLRKGCRFLRDSKMLTPRTFQLFERCRHFLGRLDATQNEVKQSEDNVPFGYVVSYFISKMLATVKSETFHFNMLQPGTLNPTLLHGGAQEPIEMEFGKCSYNLWYSALRYREEQPLCQLFVDVVDGKLPLELFGIMQRVLRNVDTRIHRYDLDGSNSFTYNKLNSSVLKMVSDMPTQVGLSAVLSVVETFRINQIPLVGGRIFTPAILADESHVEKSSSSRTERQQMPMGVRVCKKKKKMECSQGASVITRFWRRLIIQRHERAYRLVEKILGPLVIESHLVVGIFLLPIPSALDAARRFDENKKQPHEDFFTQGIAFILGLNMPFEENETEPLPYSLEGFSHRYATKVSMKKSYLQEFGYLSMQDLLTCTFGKVQRLSKSVHLPSAPMHKASTELETADSAGDGGGHTSDAVLQEKSLSSVKKVDVKRHGEAKGKGGKKKGLAAKPSHKKRDAKIAPLPPPPPPSPLSSEDKDAIPPEMVIDSDKELVEWYGFCHTMRQTVITFTENIFLDEPSQQMEKSNSLHNVAELLAFQATKESTTDEA